MIINNVNSLSVERPCIKFIDLVIFLTILTTVTATV